MKKLDNIWTAIKWPVALASLFSVVFLVCLTSTASVHAYTPPAPVNPQSSAVGLTGTITAPPPSVGATITSPSNGQTFTTQPIVVQGICPSGLLVKLFINNVFAGSAVCTDGSYKITASLFNGTNNLQVIDYDSLDQQGPTSATVTVTFVNPNVGAGPGITLTSSYAKIGVQPGSTLTWPINASGGTPPYALSIDWGDGSPPQLVSEANAGSFNLTHIYQNAGTYEILIKITDTSGNISYLQLVGVATGATGQTTSSTKLNNPSNSNKGIKLTNTTLFIIIGLIILAFLSAFWLGSRHRLSEIKRKIEKGEDL